LFIGLLLVNQENDILERVLYNHCDLVDCIYALDGTEANRVSQHLIRATGKCAGYWTDSELPRPPYPEGTVCGYRGFIYDKAVEEHGSDHWFVQLHGDEVWTFHPSKPIAAHPEADGFIFHLPFYFPRVDDGWDDGVHPLDQLQWRLEPGWPEFRLFHGGPGVHFDPAQHFDTQPRGLSRVVETGDQIKHYPYRAPGVQRVRARIHERTGYDPSNYEHILRGDRVLWTDEMIEQAKCAFHTDLHHDVRLG
jgi:hypothetical protein